MCLTCGCSDDANIRLSNHSLNQSDHAHEHTHIDEHGNVITHSHSHEHDSTHSHEHGSAHNHEYGSAKTISIEKDILAKNDALAESNRAWLKAHNVVALNILSAPGSGKTALLEETIKTLKDEIPIFVLEGDQETANDAMRIRASGCSAVQINTGAGCHLEAGMIASALNELRPADNSLLIVENVGNLVCPALFDLGEKHKIVMLSVTEGEDKPLKYPHMFRAADILILNKVDLLPYLSFDIELCIANALSVNPRLKVFRVSALRGEGLNEWFAFLRELIRESAASSAKAVAPGRDT